MTTTAILDTFTTGSTSNTGGRTADTTGGAWSNVEMVGGSGLALSGRVDPSGFAYSAGGLFGALSATSLVENQWDIYVECDRASVFPMLRVLADCDASGAGGYSMLLHNYNEEAQIRRGSTNFATLGGSVRTVAHTQPSGVSTYRFQRRTVGADAVLKIFRNGTEIASYTDTAPLAGGRRVMFAFEGAGTSEGKLLTFTATYEETAGDIDPPTLAGGITVSALTTTSYTLTWPAGSDNVVVIGYEVSLDGGSTYTPVGNVLTANITGRTPSSTDAVRVRAFDAAGLRSTPALSASVTLLSPPAFNLNSSIYAFVNNSTGLLANKPVTFWAHDETTGALLGSAITGLSTNALGIVTTPVSNASLVAGVPTRLDYKFNTGEYGVVVLTPA